ncbi:MAG: hypothetical protein N3C59_05060 [Azovibrio sp.]|nr:hypothetical protein [Azovibrio sp.]
MALAVAASLSLTPLWADAAGLGRITVYSALGQPLRAEVQVSASKDELAGMTANLAPLESFRQAGVEFSPTLTQLRFAVEKRAGGAVVKVTSERPINEPFLDFLLELNWSSGRLVREYTFLLDPPEVMAQTTRRQAVVDARMVPALPAGTEQGEVLARPAPAGKPPVAAQSRQAAEPARAERETSDAYQVKPGDTLRRIASEHLPEGVTLEQMLVALYRNNADAFSGNNMNRLRAGAVLQIPSQAQVAAVPAEEARKIFRAQSADWNSYRRKLAAAAEAAPAAESAASREAGGKIGAKVEEKLPPAEQSKDQVKVSRTQAPAAKGAVAEEDLIARDRALKESQERVAMLEKNVAELQKLLELKNQSQAELQKQAAKPTGAAPASPAAPEAAQKTEAQPEEKSAPVVATSQPQAQPETATEPAVPKSEAEPAKPEGEAAPPAEPPKPVPKPAPARKPLPPPEPIEEPSFFDDLDPLPLAAGGGVLALLLGYLFYRRRKAAVPKSDAGQSDVLPEAPREATSSFGPNSVFQTAGGQSVDTTNTTPPTTDFSQAGPGAIDTDEVDPVAEADVYMAYGRDAQAEEILLDALQKDPQRTAIHAKLLEIYANRKSVKQFETLATELYAQTGGKGSEWDKVAALGRNLDPTNPLYGSAVAPAAPAAAAAPAMPGFDAGATLVAGAAPSRSAPGAAAAPDLNLDFVARAQPADDPLAALPEEAPAAPHVDLDIGLPPVAPAAAPEPEPYVDTVTQPQLASETSLDFDLAASVAPQPVAPPASDFSATVVNPDASLDSLDFDLELDVPGATGASSGQSASASSSADTLVGDAFKSAVASAPASPSATSGNLIDFELNLGDAPAAPPAPVAAEADAAAETQVMAPLEPDEDMEFDVRLTDSPILGNPAGSGFDLSSIDLDLGGEAAAPAGAPTAAATGEVAANPRRDEVNTKLDLAKAYEDMGDLEGARELLGEVLGEGEPDQVEMARAALDRLNA